MTHEESDDDQWTCTCGDNRVPDGEGGTICVQEDFESELAQGEPSDEEGVAQ